MSRSLASAAASRTTFGDELAVDLPAAGVEDQVVLGPRGGADAAQPVQVLDHRLDQVGAHLHVADAGFRLRVGDVETGAVAVVKPDLADLQRAQLTRSHAAPAEDLADHPASDVAAADVRAELAHVEADG
ncbi:MAG TPA: hypothetical protein VFN89_12790 [Solirubrobacterales bacterium]|nr:hypothetical protein [Solirubrobacterales bacterium]